MIEALAITGHFLARDLLIDRRRDPLAARERLLERLLAPVEVEDEASGKRMTYTLVAVHEASAADGRLSAESPVAAALTGLRSGETAVVPAPRGERRLKVLAVS